MEQNSEIINKINKSSTRLIGGGMIQMNAGRKLTTEFTQRTLKEQYK